MKINAIREIGISLFILLIVTAIAIFYVADTEKFPYAFGLDLAGGAQLTYTVDIAQVPETEIAGRVAALQQVVERRINALGVSEPRVYTTSTSVFTGLPREQRLVIELPGVTNIEDAIKTIGETPHLEFQLYNVETETFELLPLQGGHIVSAGVQLAQGIGGALTGDPQVVLRFNREGDRLFTDITRNNVGRVLGIFIDGALISAPVIRETIAGGVTQIQGQFTLDEAQTLADNLNLGALPLPIELSETRTVDPTLGSETVATSIHAGAIALLLILLLFLVVYRFSGLIAFSALLVYIVFVLSIFKGIPIVLTAAGLAGFVMSLGFAVDANVLIFERMREEIQNNTDRREAIKNACMRAWAAIRDANATSIIIAILLFWFGTSIIKGFAFAFIIGVVVSMFTAYLITRVFLYATVRVAKGKRTKKWYL